VNGDLDNDFCCFKIARRDSASCRMASSRGGKEGKIECSAAADNPKVKVRVWAMTLAVRGTEKRTPISL